jgi:hypothetical protein
VHRAAAAAADPAGSRPLRLSFEHGEGWRGLWGSGKVREGKGGDGAAAVRERDRDRDRGVI